MKLCKLLAVLLVFTLLPELAHALGAVDPPTYDQCLTNGTQKTFCADGGGCDYSPTGPGAEKSWAELRADVRAGWTVTFKTGNYTLEGQGPLNSGSFWEQSGSEGTPICFVAEDLTAPPVITISPYYYWSFKQTHHIVIYGLTFQNGGMLYFGDGGALSGTKSYKITVQKNRFINTKQNNYFQQVEDVWFDQNYVDHSGWAGCSSQRDITHCHGIYITPGCSSCTGKTSHRITISRNIIKNGPGNGIQLRTQGSSFTFDDVLVQNNLLINLPREAIVIGSDNSMVKNNTIIIKYFPTTDPYLTGSGYFMRQAFWFHYGVQNTTIKNNFIYKLEISPRNPSDLGFVLQEGNPVTTFTHPFDYNIWYTPNSQKYNWELSYTDFNVSWKPDRGQDANGTVLGSFNTGNNFVDFANDDYALKATSVLIDQGDNCPTTDITGTIRTGTCDVGAYSYEAAAPTLTADAVYWNTAGTTCANAAAAPLASVTKGTEYQWCGDYTLSSGTLAAGRLALVLGSTTGALNTCSSATLVPDTNVLRLNLNASSDPNNKVTYYPTPGNVNSSVTVHAPWSVTGYYSGNGVVDKCAVDADTTRLCTNVTIAADTFPDGLSDNQAAAKDASSPALCSALFTDADSLTVSGTSGTIPVTDIKMKTGTTYSVNRIPSSTIVLTIDCTETGVACADLSSAYYQCEGAGCPDTDQHALADPNDVPKDITITGLKSGLSTYKYHVEASGGKSAEDTIVLSYQPFKAGRFVAPGAIPH